MKARKLLYSILASSMLITAPLPAFAAGPIVGKKAASKYFGRSTANEIEEQNTDIKGEGHRERNNSEMLMLSLGSYLNSTSYAWKGEDKRDNVGQLNYGVTYLFDSWGKLDTNLRMDFSEYKIDGDRARKLSVLPVWTFPSVESRFPLYFGFGLGLGVFFSQLPDESNLSFDYQLIAGARFMDLFQNIGFFAELAQKNHLHLLSDGQFNGTALTAGAVFSF